MALTELSELVPREEHEECEKQRGAYAHREGGQVHLPHTNQHIRTSAQGQPTCGNASTARERHRLPRLHLPRSRAQPQAGGGPPIVAARRVRAHPPAAGGETRGGKRSLLRASARQRGGGRYAGALLRPHVRSEVL